jgi:hypothetical protein
MKLFTVKEANKALPGVRYKLEKIQRMYSTLGRFRESARAAASASDFGGGMSGGAVYVKVLYDIGKLTTELHESGIQLKDYERGLIDFPCMRDGRIILLCWQLGEEERIEWWHEIEAGFAGRKPL